MSGLGTYNFKKIAGLLQTLANTHEQVESYGIGDMKQLIYYITERLKEDNTENNLSPYYPLLWVVPQGMRNDGRQSIYDFNILCMDILNTKNFENEIDVWSDTLDILKDVLAQLKYAVGTSCYCSWDVEVPVNFTPFSEQYDDYVSGWNMNIKLIIPDAINLCIAPYAEFPPCIDNSDC
jgi:hypothetical protein